MVKIGVPNVTAVEHGVRARFSVRPFLTGFLVQRVEWRAVVGGQRFSGGWSEAWTLRKTPRRFEQQGVDSFLVPEDWLLEDGEMSIQAIAWFQRFLPDTFKRVPGQTDKFGRLRGTDALVDPPDGADVLERLWMAKWRGGKLTTNRHRILG